MRDRRIWFAYPRHFEYINAGFGVNVYLIPSPRSRFFLGFQMRQRFVEIKTAGGVMEAFVTHPEDNRPFSAVIIYMDIWGVREELYDIARRVGAVGYYCMVPDLY